MKFEKYLTKLFIIILHLAFKLTVLAKWHMLYAAIYPTCAETEGVGTRDPDLPEKYRVS